MTILLRALLLFIINDINDIIDTVTGYATFNYEEGDYRVSDLIKVVIAVNGEPCDPLSFVSHSTKVRTYVSVYACVYVCNVLHFTISYCTA